MSRLEIQTTDGRTSFLPGEEVSGTIAWDLSEPVTGVELLLMWSTRGKGTINTEIADSVRFDHPALHDQQEFRLRLPEVPYSFSGRLVSVVWCLKLVTMPRVEVLQLPIVVSPTAQEIDLYAAP